MRLYRNSRDLIVADVTEKTVVLGGGYGQGAAAGDYDNDGVSDRYVNAVWEEHLSHNNGDGTFDDVAEKAGVAASWWTSSAVWFDYGK
jgi:hypothetical protein